MRLAVQKALDKLCFLRSDSQSIFDIRRFIMIKHILVPLLATLLLVGATASLTACNTVAGAGKDIQQTGSAIKDEANEHR